MKPEYFDTFGKRVRFLRQGKNWTQGQLAAEMAKHGFIIRNTWISELEKAPDNKTPSIEAVIAFAKALGTTVDFLLLQTDDTEIPGTKEPEFFSVEADEAAHAIDALPPAYRARALTQVRAVREQFNQENQEYEVLMNLIEEVAGAEARARIERRLINQVFGAGGTVPHFSTHQLLGDSS